MECGRTRTRRAGTARVAAVTHNARWEILQVTNSYCFLVSAICYMVWTGEVELPRRLRYVMSRLPKRAGVNVSNTSQ
jgi:hypothetical protein